MWFLPFWHKINTAGKFDIKIGLSDVFFQNKHLLLQVKWDNSSARALDFYTFNVKAYNTQYIRQKNQRKCIDLSYFLSEVYQPNAYTTGKQNKLLIFSR